ncbi:MAG: hypothetical protein ACRYFK_11610 [Janthinobacterium lividum]
MFKQLLILSVGSLLLGQTAARAQTAPAYDLGATHRYVQATQLWPQAQGEFGLANGDYLLLGLRGQRVLDNQLTSGRSLGFDARQALGGYEHFGQLNPHWSYGATARLVGVGSGQPVAFVPEVLGRHRAPIFGGITLGQRLGVERTFSSGSTQALESGPDGQFWGRLRVDAERFFYVGGSRETGVVLRPRLSYEAATHLRLQKATNDPDERTIQYTALRGEVGVRLGAAVDITPWFAYQTRYLETLPQYDVKGNPTAGGKLNAVYPTLGLDLRFTLLPGGAGSDRQQLPTQH